MYLFDCGFFLNHFLIILIYFFNDFPNTIIFSTVQHGDPVTHTCIHSFFSPIVMPHHKRLDRVPIATEQDLTANPFQRQ